MIFCVISIGVVHVEMLRGEVILDFVRMNVDIVRAVNTIRRMSYFILMRFIKFHARIEKVFSSLQVDVDERFSVSVQVLQVYTLIK